MLVGGHLEPDGGDRADHLHLCAGEMYAVVAKHVFPFLRALGAEWSTHRRSDDLDLFTRDVGALREAFDELPEIATSIWAHGLPEPLPFGRTAFWVSVGASIVKVDFVTDRGPLLSPPRNPGPP